MFIRFFSSTKLKRNCLFFIRLFWKRGRKTGKEKEMSADWGPVVVAVGLFILLSPGLLFQLPARTRVVEFGNMCTSGIAILVHAIIYFCIVTILIVAIGIHIHVNWCAIPYLGLLFLFFSSLFFPYVFFFRQNGVSNFISIFLILFFFSFSFWGILVNCCMN